MYQSNHYARKTVKKKWRSCIVNHETSMFIDDDKQNIISVCEILGSDWYGRVGYGTAVRWMCGYQCHCGPFTFIRIRRKRYSFNSHIYYDANHCILVQTIPKGGVVVVGGAAHYINELTICQLLVTYLLRFNWTRIDVRDCNFVHVVCSTHKYAACSLIYNSNVDSQPPERYRQSRIDHTIEVQTLYARPFSLRHILITLNTLALRYSRVSNTHSALALIHKAFKIRKCRTYKIVVPTVLCV